MANPANTQLSVNEQLMDLVKLAQGLVLNSISPEQARDSKVLRLLTLLEMELED